MMADHNVLTLRPAPARPRAARRFVDVQLKDQTPRGAADELDPRALEAAFPLDSVLTDIDGRVCFSHPTRLEQARTIFARWGLRLYDYCGSMDEFLAAWYAVTGRSHTELSTLLAGTPVAMTSEHQEYLRAVHAGDTGGPPSSCRTRRPPGTSSTS
ncbi:hypothetical protein [Ramlibacter alkalitolerans]|uniref:Barstar (barnase inhibitor) domain-containing protein n=1 Tax=Ramlibacter alkalitolerans TaxID=2039631 RepID=A0ABS1JTS8_9BURK|nr:hypothetical protein [Ramlibacter alkalitolerans]MBL0427659.1 hypothetical protein [Ramlibacter alkalitolerans]